MAIKEKLMQQRKHIDELEKHMYVSHFRKPEPQKQYHEANVSQR